MEVVRRKSLRICIGIQDFFFTIMHLCVIRLRVLVSASSCESSSGSSIRVYIAHLITELLNITELSETCIERQLLPAAMALLHDDDV